ncbi:MAG: hypothetical protein R3Y35_11025, partial [Clostridia bacterium]
MENGELSEGMTGTVPGMTEGLEGMEDMTEEELAEMQEAMENGEIDESMMSGMTGMTGMIGSTSMELSDEEASYTIPVGATVYVNGSESSFSYITEESYITITMNEDGTIIEVSVMG